MWRQRRVPYLCERLIGFSVPRDGHVLVISYEGVHTVWLGSEIRVETDDAYAEYDPDSGLARYSGRTYSIIGLHGGRPLLERPQGEELSLDVEAERLSVLQGGEVVYATEYENFSGDWAAATFSPDGNFIVLGCPYGFDFMVLERAKTG